MKRILYLLIIILTPVVSMGQTGSALKKPQNYSSGEIPAGNYYLSEDMTLTASSSSNYRYNIVSNRTVTIDLYGHTIDASKLSRSVFSIASGKLYIKDTKGGGRIKNSSVSCFYIDKASGATQAILYLQGGTISNCRPSDGNGGAVEVCDNGKLFISNNAVITECNAVQGAAIHVGANGYMEMSGGEIKNNKVYVIEDDNTWTIPEKGSLPIGISSNKNPKTTYSYDDNDIPAKNGHYEYKGGAVYVNGGTFTMTGGTISGNVSINGGGVYVTGNSTFSLEGGTLKNNYSTSKGFDYGNGGAIYLSNGAKCTIKKQEGKDLIINENAATRYGGAIYVDGSTITIDGVTINENSASSGGGLAQYGTSCTMTLKNSDINTNYSLSQNADTHKGGAGIFVNNGTLNIESSTHCCPVKVPDDYYKV